MKFLTSAFLCFTGTKNYAISIVDCFKNWLVYCLNFFEGSFVHFLSVWGCIEFRFQSFDQFFFNCIIVDFSKFDCPTGKKALLNFINDDFFVGDYYSLFKLSRD